MCVEQTPLMGLMGWWWGGPGQLGGDKGNEKPERHIIMLPVSLHPYFLGSGYHFT